jgi:hypothetical protein
MLELPIAADDVLSVIGSFVSPGGWAQKDRPSWLTVFQVGNSTCPLRQSAASESTGIRIRRRSSIPATEGSKYGPGADIEAAVSTVHSRRWRNSAFAVRNAFARSTQDLDRRLLQSNLGGAIGKQGGFFGAAKHFQNDESAIVNAMTLTGPVVANVPTVQRKDGLFSRVQWWPSEPHTLCVTYAYKAAAKRPQLRQLLKPNLAHNRTDFGFRRCLGGSSFKRTRGTNRRRSPNSTSSSVCGVGCCRRRDRRSRPVARPPPVLQSYRR